MNTRQQKRRSERRRASVRAGVVGGGALALGLVPTGIAQASTPIKVTNLHDSGAGSLRAAITTADSDTAATPSSPALITFSSKLSGSIDLKSPLPGAMESIDIKGPGARKVTLNAGEMPKDSGVPLLYDVFAGTHLTISGLSMDNATDSATGGFVDVVDAGLTLNSDTFARDSGMDGGGAVYVDANSVTIDGCTFTDDRAYYGGAIDAFGSTTAIADSTFVGNHASHGGGAIWAHGGTLKLTGVTVSSNSVSYSGTSMGQPAGYGGGIGVSYASLTLDDSIVAGDTASGNVHYANHPLFGSDHRDVWVGKGASLSAQFSLIQHDYNSLYGLNSTDILDKSPDLGPLQNNGGQTNTESPPAKSPVINAGKAFGLTVDQRGDKRKVAYPGVNLKKGSDGTDIGAVELQAPKKKHRH
jgi:predicted outer membrane repeat protein